MEEIKSNNTSIDLPSTWEIVKLGKFVENEKGKKPQSELKVETPTHNLPYVDIQAFEEGIIKSWTDGIGCRLCYESDFLMVWDGSRSGLVGKGMNGALGSTLVRINFPLMVNDYAFYFLQSKFQQINTRAKGSGTPHVDPDLLWNYDFPIPPKNEQYRIVAKIEALFSELDKGIESFKTAREQLKIYRQALLKHAFSGKLTEQWRAENQDAAQERANAAGGQEPGAAKLETAEALLQRIQTEREERYQQQLKDWEKSPSIPLLQRGKPSSSKQEISSIAEPIPPFVKGGLGGIPKPKPPKTLPPLTAEELAELPELPEGWAFFMMGDVCLESILGKMLDKEKNKGELKPYLRNINVRWGNFNLDNLLEMRFEETEHTRFGLNDGDLVICEGGEPGRCAVWRKELGQDMQIQKALHRIRFTNSINSTFVQMYFEFCASNRRLEKMFTGTTIKHLTGEKLARMTIPICSVDEQKQILLELESKFSEIEQLDQTLTTALQQAEALRQSILKKAFSGQLIPQDPNDEPASVLLERIQAEKTQTNSQATRQRGKN